MTVRVVVGGAVIDQGRLLAARRSAPAELAGRWELPGGKCEPGETAPQALVRELREELGVEVEPVEALPGQWPVKPGYVLQVWTAVLRSGVPAPLQDHDRLRWLAPEAADEVDWLEADRPAVAEVMRRLAGGGARPADPASRKAAGTPNASSGQPERHQDGSRPQISGMS